MNSDAVSIDYDVIDMNMTLIKDLTPDREKHTVECVLGSNGCLWKSCHNQTLDHVINQFILHDVTMCGFKRKK